MSEIDVSKCPYKGGLECHIRDYPIEYCADVKIEDCHYKQLQRYKQAVKEIKEIAEECYYKCNSMNNCNISCKYYNNCNGEFSYLLACLNKQISECEVEDEK